MSRSLLAVLLLAGPTLALEPKDIIIVANKDVKESVDLADYYVRARKVPKENVVRLSLPTGEDIGRNDYNAKFAGPLRDALKDRKDSVKCLLTLTGVPLRVGPKELTAEQNAEARRLEGLRVVAYREAADAAGVAPANIQRELTAKANDLSRQWREIVGDQTSAAVDSELMLLWWPNYSLDRWVRNPLYWQIGDDERKKSPPVLMTCRIDAPTLEICKRIIDDSIAVEAVGLKGKAYFDARGIKFDAAKPGASGTGYEGYDESFREAAALLKSGGVDVTLDDKNDLFPEKSCPDAALYSGWYSHANFKDCCIFAKGAVAWHLASSEAVTLRDAKSKVWCPNLLKRGVCATLGPVAEPYTLGFPKPAEFFGFLATGKYTLAEVYSRTLTCTSWQVTCIGDPLYNPFAKNPVLKEADVFSSPKGIKAFK